MSRAEILQRQLKYLYHEISELEEEVRIMLDEAEQLEKELEELDE